jgi:hypothetical protein
MSLRLPTKYENGELRHAGMDGRHPSGAQDASGDIHVALDSSTPCWNDGIDKSYETDPDPLPLVFSKSLDNIRLLRNPGGDLSKRGQ